MRNKVAIKKTAIANKSAGGIILPAEALKDTTTGIVIASGICEFEGNILKEGDFVIFGKYAGTSIKVQNEDYIIMKNEEVLAVIEK